MTEVPKSSGTRLVDRVFKMRELAILVVFLVMIVVTQIGNSDFLTEQGIKDLLLNATILVLVATGQSLVVITRNVDLSVGSTLGISAFAAGTYLQGGGNPVVAIVLAVLLGIGFGLLNGLLVSLGQVPALVVTLGTLYIIRGIDSIWVGSRQITAADLPDSFVNFGSGGISAVPWLALIALAVLVATAYYLKHFGSGRELYALGSNPEAARLAGIPVRKRILAAYTFCGALARPRRGDLPGPVRQRRLRSRHRLRTDRRQRGRGRRCRLHRRLRQRLRRGPRRPAADLHQQRAARPRRQLRSGCSPSTASCSSSPSRSTRSSRCAWPPH
ncbi:hypothetical protein SGRIM119S_06654 [Streptomyces griseorubiginosus]